jgi:hypothetical protein
MFDERDLRQKIKRLSEAVWEQRATGAEVDAWLANFGSSSRSSVDQRLPMLYLLSNFVYFGVREVRELLRAQFHNLCHRMISGIRRENADTINLDLIDDQLNRAVWRTRFLGIGNPSESGQHLLYYFRQENMLPGRLFINHVELPGLPAARPEHGAGEVDQYVFIDDLCGTGDQALDFASDVVSHLNQACPQARTVYFPLFATTSGLQRVLERGIFTAVECVMELDESFKCFSPTSRIYVHSSLMPERDVAEGICRYYGSVLWPAHPLGYRDGQLAIGFSHNTPDNTLPIFWSDPTDIVPSWRAIFRRYRKA